MFVIFSNGEVTFVHMEVQPYNWCVTVQTSIWYLCVTTMFIFFPSHIFISSSLSILIFFLSLSLYLFSLSLSLSLYIYIRICKVVKLVTVVEGDLKAPLSIATVPRCRGGRYFFPWIAPRYP